MKVIILAAGRGERLFPLTKSIPKALITVGENTLLGYQLYNIESLGIKDEDIVVVGGHCIEKIISYVSPKVQIIYNSYYNKYDNIYSLWLTREIAQDGFILINSDVLFHKMILKRLLISKFPDVVCIDDHEKLGQEGMKVIIKNGRLKKINKNIDPQKANGEYIGLSKFSDVGAKILFNKIEEIITQNKYEVWYEYAFEKIADQRDIFKVSTQNLPWVEVDNFDDLEKAKKMVFSYHREG